MIREAFQAQFCMISYDSWHRFLHSFLVPEAPHTSHNLEQKCQESAKDRQETAKNIQINDGTDTPSTIHPPQLAKRITARQAQNAGAVSTPHGFFKNKNEHLHL